jgi:uncharacterized membrane protein
LVNTRHVAGAAIFTAFVFAVTFSFAATTSTGGYFDVGEIMVYITALVMGPYVGAFAGGVGSMLSDALLAPQFAVGTLVIKGAEGFIVGYLGQRFQGSQAERHHRLIGVILAVLVASTVVAAGTIAFPDISLLIGQQGFTPVASSPDIVLSFSFWLVLGALVLAATLLISKKIGPRFAWVSLAIILGGAEMVVGYFLYETQVLQLGLASPSAEVPVNALQAIAGLLIAPPVAARVQGAFGKQLRSTEVEAGKGALRGGSS